MLTLRENPHGSAPAGGPRGATGPAGRPPAVVIGAGFGGLAAAARLGARGYDVTLVEKLDGPGGRGYQFQIDGFTFDSGPTIITAPFLFEELWKACGRDFHQDVTLKQLDPFYRIRFDDGDTFDTGQSHDKMVEEVRRISPSDVDGYLRFEKIAAKIYDYAFVKLANEPFNRLWHLARMMPNLIRLGGYLSPYRFVALRMKHEKLRFAFSFHPLFIGGDPFNSSALYCLINKLERDYGVAYAMGGTGALVRAMADLVGHVGGRIRYETEVDEILSKDGRATGVRLKSGETLPADVVVCNADPAVVYRQMMPGVRRRRWTDAKLDRMRYSMSVFVWYFGTRRRYDDLAHHTIVLGPRYKPLIKDIFSRHKLAEDFSLYLYRPSASDPSMAPEGCDSYYVLSPVPHLDSGDDWTQIAESYRQKIEKRLQETVMPGLKDEIVVSRVTTPLDFKHRLNSWKGAAFGFEPTLLQSGWFRPHNDSEELKGLWFVGAGTHPGAGLPGAVGSAKIVDEMIPEPVIA